MKFYAGGWYNEELFNVTIKLLLTWLIDTEGNMGVMICLSQGDLCSQNASSSSYILQAFKGWSHQSGFTAYQQNTIPLIKVSQQVKKKLLFNEKGSF